MAITTLTELETAVGNWLDRTDLSSRIPEFIVLFEAVANRRLRVRQMQASSTLTQTLTTDFGYVTLPTDFLEILRVTRVATAPLQLEWVNQDYFLTAFPTMDTPSPLLQINQSGIFTIEGTALRIKPIDSSQIEVAYYQKIPALSGSNESTHWLFTAHPDAYLAGTLAEAVVFTEAPDQAQLWMARRDAAFEEIRRLDTFNRGRSSVRPTMPTP